ncbi:hypothetical protein P175DRAFT_0518437 [Aspergillus ochraceoroseus IBT 24754]|uniref:Zinc transporter n=1 Tax=Aspergillus ochraceoroseus IBT 24754 TaxID=1392256 RepID=A0A2T5LNZ5_9EURO|nr:uncharacterized protein P175DRAFT_0518437 [Aspergillus ochraceoroseus IBT 24754]PTU18001.1 hypothetical protein P175DRAFT_0518437 [Aspergillus ochraceoroseus IBT 24754]
MATGIPVSSTDTISSFPQGYGFGHSRGHGHSRSARPARTPLSNSISSNDVPSPQQPLSRPVTDTDHSNGHMDDSKPCGHHHSHSHASTPHDHIEPPTTIHAYGDLVKPGERLIVSKIQSELMPRSHEEVVAGLIIALPWIALSWYYEHYAQWTPQEEGALISIGKLDHATSHTWNLAAGTLLLYGCGQLVRLSQRAANSSETKMPKLDATTAHVTFTQICSISLPIYATLKVGGFLVAFAMALAVGAGIPTLVRSQRSKGKLNLKKLTVILLPAAILFSFLGINSPWDSQPLFGYIALLISVFLLRPPFSAITQSGSVPGTGLDSSQVPPNTEISYRDSLIAILSGLSALLVSIVAGKLTCDISAAAYLLAVAGSFATCLAYLIPSDLSSPNKIGLAVATGSAAIFCSPPARSDIYIVYIFRGFLAAVCFFAARYDDRHSRLVVHSHHHDRSRVEASRATKLILQYSEPYPLLYSILKESDSRRIFYFMSLNFGFMLVQLSYGFATGSLGLLSDSIHMFFDCLALVVGLCAAVMSKWPPSTRFPYGYGKVDTLSGFANGIFLMIISVEIIYEAVERLSSGSQMHRLGELLVVSLAGLCVNLVGIMAFEHGHAHGHDHGHGHSHGHGNENMHGIFLHILADTLGSVAVVISTILVHYSGWSGYDPIASCLIAILIFASAVPLVSSTAKTLLLALPADIEYNVRETLAGVSTLRGVVGYTVPKFWLDDTEPKSSSHDHGHDHGCSHTHNHGHSHNHSHTRTHTHSDPYTHSPNHDHDHDHDHSHNHNHNHDHAHEKHTRPVLGVIHVIASRAADLEDVRERTTEYLREKGMDILVQVEREGEGRCWCGGGANKTS